MNNEQKVEALLDDARCFKTTDLTTLAHPDWIQLGRKYSHLVSFKMIVKLHNYGFARRGITL